MKRMKKLAALFLVICMAVSVIGCGPSKSSQGTGNSDYRVAMITDSGDITDQSFNQTTYEACLEYCTENNIDFTYKKPDGDTDYARIAMIDVAVAEGYNIIVMPGYIFAPALVEVTYKYPDVKFIALDMTAGDIIAAAVGNKYYENPDAYEASDYYNVENTYCAVYQEEIPGYMAGYAAVKLGYRKLGFLGGQAVPAVMRYGFGYVQGINDAAKELGITDQEILDAVRFHTVGAPHMTPLQQLTYVADFIEPGRDFPDVATARAVAQTSLEQAVVYETKHTLTYLMANDRPIYPAAIATYNAWIGNRK